MLYSRFHSSPEGTPPDHWKRMPRKLSARASGSVITDVTKEMSYSDKHNGLQCCARAALFRLLCGWCLSAFCKCGNISRLFVMPRPPSPLVALVDHREPEGGGGENGIRRRTRMNRLDAARFRPPSPHPVHDSETSAERRGVQRADGQVGFMLIKSFLYLHRAGGRGGGSNEARRAKDEHTRRGRPGTRGEDCQPETFCASTMRSVHAQKQRDHSTYLSTTAC